MKSISIVHTGYVVAINTTRSDLAFCNTMVLTYRATWAVLPWTVFVLSWILLLCNEEQTETTSQQSEKSNEQQKVVICYKYLCQELV